MLPEYGELLVTFGDVDALAWSYAEHAPRPGLVTRLLGGTESVMRQVLAHGALLERRPPITRQPGSPVLGPGTRVVFFTEGERYHQAMQSGTGNWEGFAFEFVTSRAALAGRLRQKESVDLVVLAMPFAEHFALLEEVERLQPAARTFLRSTSE